MKLTRQRINDLKRIFKQIDKEGTELLDKVGLDEALTELGYDHVDLDRALQQVGREQEGHVIFEDFQEIVIGLESQHQQDETDQSREQAFELLADPELGGITFARLQHLAKMQGHDWTKEDLQGMMVLGDKDHDGLITREDFARIWENVGI
ncbi:hypothetical protein [Absidia glauca]|uniref:EF-hand domain-containing protein n=1 Tax=Absidia glauca TaxID=4829 RepID=A0A163K2E2_ABSGL|nr:hypothetical protein [Absidia glauca]